VIHVVKILNSALYNMYDSCTHINHVITDATRKNEKDDRLSKTFLEDRSMSALPLRKLCTFLWSLGRRTLETGEGTESVGNKMWMSSDHAFPAGRFHDIDGMTTSQRQNMLDNHVIGL